MLQAGRWRRGRPVTAAGASRTVSVVRGGGPPCRSAPPQPPRHGRLPARRARGPAEAGLGAEVDPGGTEVHQVG